MADEIGGANRARARSDTFFCIISSFAASRAPLSYSLQAADSFSAVEANDERTLGKRGRHFGRLAGVPRGRASRRRRTARIWPAASDDCAKGELKTSPVWGG